MADSCQADFYGGCSHIRKGSELSIEGGENGEILAQPSPGWAARKGKISEGSQPSVDNPFQLGCTAQTLTAPCSLLFNPYRQEDGGDGTLFATFDHSHIRGLEPT